jgi:hypothetical protein
MEFAMANETLGSVSVMRATVAGALTFGILFAGCWVGIGLHIAVSHMFVSLFTAQPMQTTAALLDGLCWSVLFGALFGLLFSFLYNALPFGRR